MRRLRVLVVGVPKLLRDVLRRAVSAQPDMVLAEERVARIESISLTRQDGDVVVLLLGGATRASVDERVRGALPPGTVIALYAGGYNATLYRSVLQPAVDLPVDTSVDALLQAIRESVEAP